MHAPLYALLLRGNTLQVLVRPMPSKAQKLNCVGDEDLSQPTKARLIVEPTND